MTIRTRFYHPFLLTKNSNSKEFTSWEASFRSSRAAGAKAPFLGRFFFGASLSRGLELSMEEIPNINHLGCIPDGAKTL